MKVPGPFSDYPPKWGTFDHYVKHMPTIAFGFVCGGGDVNRFAARYRAAKTFRRVEFEDVVIATTDGYSALCQLLLTFSAFEHFLRCIGVEMQHSLNLLKPAERPLASASLRKLVGEHELFRWLRPHMTNRSYQRQIDAHLAGQEANLFYLSGSLRHTFAHGIITATPAGVPPTSVATVCRFLSRGLMRVMDREFEERMTEFEKFF